MRHRGVLNRVSPLAIAVVLSVAAAITIVTVGSLTLDLKPAWPPRLEPTTSANLPIGNASWGAPWDDVAISPITPVDEAITGVLDSLGWLIIVGSSICVLALLLHALAWSLSSWNGLVVRAALGARWRHLFTLLSRRWLAVGIVGVAAGLTIGMLLGAWFDSAWPSLLTHPSRFVAMALGGGSVGVALLCLVTVIAGTAPVPVSGRRQLTSELTGDRATAGHPILGLQSLLAVLGFAGLLVVSFAASMMWLDAPRVSEGVRLSEQSPTIATVHASGSVTDTATRAATFHALWERERAGGADSFALTSPGAWLGLGPIVPVMAFCEACFVGQFFTPVTRADVRILAVGPGAISALSGEIMDGRDLTETDQVGAAPVVLLNESAASHLFPGADSVGRTLHIGASFETEHTVAGVVHHTPPAGPGNTGPIPPVIFVSIFQHPPPAVELATSGDVEDRQQPQLGGGTAGVVIESVRALSADLRRFQAPGAFFTRQFLTMALLAAAAATVSLAVVMTQVVAVRRRELAVRLALGARPRHILNWVIGRALRIVGAGITIGIVGARLIWEVLYPGRSPEGGFGPLVALAGVFTVIAVVATIYPAHRATRLQPALLWATASRRSGVP